MDSEENSFSWKKLKIQYKKILLYNYLEENSSDDLDKIISTKNNILFKSLIYELTDENIIVNNGKIIEIKGIDRNNNGLFYICDQKIFKKKKKKSKK